MRYAGNGSSQLASAEGNRADILKKYYELADARPFQPEKLRSFYAENLVDHDAAEPNVDTIETVLGFFTSLAEGAPDSKHELQIVEPAGKDLVIVYWKYRGTHTGNLLGIPATNKKFDIAGIEIYKIADSKITDVWHVEDIAGMMAQLGLAGK